jgi:eukaryotic-like serine/threonine-protein kinase
MSIRTYTPGDVLAERYELIRPLGKGGMGVVWSAHDRVLNVEVALKLITQPTRETIARAQTEARAAARLAHPAVCRVSDYGRTEQDEPFVVTELLSGETLEELVDRSGPLTPTEAVQTLLPILDAIEAAHASGIVHRDVKPSNIFLAHTNHRVQPKLLDFGIARWVDEKTRNTTTGSIVGTPDYMSPEQARGSRDVGMATDIWSFSATLYEALTGSVPFRGENYNSVLWTIQNTDPRPLTASSPSDAELSDIVLRGLRRDVGERWSSATVLACALSRWLLAQGIDTDVCGNSVRDRAMWRAEGSGSDSGVDSREPCVLPSRHAITVRSERSVEPATRRWRPLATRSVAVVVGVLSLFALAAYSLGLARSEPEQESRTARAEEPRSDTPAAATNPSGPTPEERPVADPPRPTVASSLPPARTGAVERPRASRRTPLPPARAVEEPVAPAPAPSSTAEPTITTQTTDATRSAPREKKSNALGYDFGL